MHGAPAAEAELGRAGKLVVDHRIVAEVATHPAVGVRYVGAQEAQLAGFLPGFLVDAVLLAPALVVGNDFLFGEPARGGREQLVLLGHPRRAIIFQHCDLLP